MKERLRIIVASQLLLTILLLGVITSFFLFVYPYHLFLQEQMQLFVFASDYFLSYFQKPAWLACYLGDFFTQFFYFRGGGAVVLGLFFVLDYLLLHIVFVRMRFHGNRPLFVLLVLVSEWFLYTGSFYRLACTTGFVIAVAFFLLYSCISKSKWSVVVGLLFALLIYPLVGYQQFTFIVLVIFYEIRNRKFNHWFYWLLLVTAGLLFPVFSRDYYLLTISQAFLYPGTEIMNFLPLFSLVIGMVYLLFRKDIPSFRWMRNESFVLFSIISFCTALTFTHADTRNEELFALDSEAYFGNWDRVLDLAEKTDRKDPVISYFTNLALSHRGELPDRLMEFYQPFTDGLLLHAVPGKSFHEIRYSGEAYFYLGDMNMAQHATMLGMIASPYHRSSRFVRRLAEINLINGDSTATVKYLKLLEATLFHKKWAQKRRKWLEEEVALPWVKTMRSHIPTYDTLRTSDDGLASLTLLVASNPENRAALDYLLCYHLLNKDIRSFKSVYDSYRLGNEDLLPKVYAEALLIALAAEKSSPKDLENYHIPATLTADFIAYTKAYESKTDLHLLEKNYQTSYWFYYHFAQLKKK